MGGQPGAERSAYTCESLTPLFVVDLDSHRSVWLRHLEQHRFEPNQFHRLTLVGLSLTKRLCAFVVNKVRFGNIEGPPEDIPGLGAIGSKADAVRTFLAALGFRTSTRASVAWLPWAARPI